MPCYKPLKAFADGLTPAGKTNLVFKYPSSFNPSNPPEIITLPCGQCIGCRLERSRQWALRCVHEASLHEDNSFITLTYATENLPDRNSLEKKDFQKFMKRLRKAVHPKKIRYYMCGEYGEKHMRPHFHACIFGYDFPDKEIWTVRDDIRLYRSAELERIWPYGHSSIGNVTFDSAAYVARYVMKKITGADAVDHYERVDGKTGEIYSLTPEYTNMSLRPGIGKDWYDLYKGDLKKDFITQGGVKMALPKYYDKLLERDDPTFLEHLKSIRKENALKSFDDNMLGHRLADKEAIKLKQTKTLIRTID